VYEHPVPSAVADSEQPSKASSLPLKRTPTRKQLSSLTVDKH
jgi:hypothetical protein